MKKKLAFWEIPAIVLAFGMALAGCDTGGGGGPGAPITEGGGDGTGQDLTVIITNIPAQYNGQQATVLLTFGNVSGGDRLKKGVITNGTVTVHYNKEGFNVAQNTNNWTYGYVQLSAFSNPSAFETDYNDKGCNTKCNYNAGTFTVPITDFTADTSSNNWPPAN